MRSRQHRDDVALIRPWPRSGFSCCTAGKATLVVVLQPTSPAAWVHDPVVLGACAEGAAVLADEAALAAEILATKVRPSLFCEHSGTGVTLNPGTWRRQWLLPT